MATTIVNQNNIVDVIKDSIQIIDSIINIVSNTVNTITAIKMHLMNYESILTMVFGKDGTGGVFGHVEEINRNIGKNRISRIHLAHTWRLLRLQFGEIKELIEIVVELADDASKINKVGVDILYDSISKIHNIFQLLSSMPVNPIVFIKMEIARAILYTVYQKLMRPLRYIGLKMIRDYKGIILGIPTIELLTRTFLPLFQNFINKLNELPLLQYFLGMLKMMAAVEIMKGLSEVILVIASVSETLTASNFTVDDLVILWMAHKSLELIASMLSFTDTIDVVMTIIAIKYNLWDYVLQNVVKIFEILREISKHNYKYATMLKVFVLLTTTRVALEMIGQIFTMKTLWLSIIPIKLGLWNYVYMNVVHMFEIIRNISMHQYKYKTMLHMLMLLTISRMVFGLLGKILTLKRLWMALPLLKLNMWFYVKQNTIQMFDVLNEINNHKYSVMNLFVITIRMTFIMLIFKMLFEIMGSKNIWGTFISSKLKIWDKLITGTQKMFTILNEINNHKYSIKNLMGLTVRMFFMTYIFKYLMKTMKYLTGAAWLAALGMPALTALTLALTVLDDTIKIIKKIARKISKKTAVDLLKVSGIIALLGIMGVSLFLVAITGRRVLMNLHIIVGFIIALVPIMGMIYLISFAAIGFTLIGPFATAGLWAFALMVTSLGLIAVQLYLISKIELDKEAVLNTVDTVLSVCYAIMNRMFGDEESQRFELEENPGWKDLIAGIFSGAPEIIKAFSACIVLVITIISVFAIVLIVTQLNFIQVAAAKLDKAKILEAVNTITGVSRFIWKSVFNSRAYDKETGSIQETEDGKRNWFIRFFKGVGDFVTVLASSAMLVSTMISVFCIFLIANTLESLSKINLQEDIILSSIETVMNCAKKVISKVREPAPITDGEKDPKQGWLGKIAKFLLPASIADTFSAFMSMPLLLFTWISIAMLKQIVEGLTTINDLPKLDNVVKNTGVIMEKCKEVVEKVKSNSIKDITNKHVRSVRRVKRIINLLLGITKLDFSKASNIENKLQNVNTLADGLKQSLTDHISKIILPEETEKVYDSIRILEKIMKEFSKIGAMDIANNVDWSKDGGVTKCLNGIEAIVDRLKNKDTRLGPGETRRAMRRLKRYAELLHIMTNMASRHLSEFRGQDLDAHHKFITSNMKFLETIENINEAKLSSAVKLFKQMARFSESINGNFKDLADALNVKLMPLMEELKELLEGVQDKVEQTGANISASTYAASQGNLTEEQHAQQINRENPTASPEEQNKLLQKRLFEQSQQNSQLIAKIDELIDLFRYGQAKVSVE